MDIIIAAPLLFFLVVCLSCNAEVTLDKPAASKSGNLTAPSPHIAVYSQLYFGLSIDPVYTNGIPTQVTEEAFAAFLDSVVTPRFPDGLSVIDIPLGQYLNSLGQIIEEASKLVVI